MSSGISGVDTRALTRHLRERGAMRVGLFSGDAVADVDTLVERVRASPEMVGADLAHEVTTAQPYVVPAVGERRFTVAALDLGIKAATPRYLAQQGCEVHVLPATATGEELLALAPDGVFLSNGPGDPATTDGPVAGCAGRARRRRAAVRHLLRQPGPRPGARASARTSCGTATAA